MKHNKEELKSYITGLRRELHRIPEIGNSLPKTQARVCEELDKLRIPYRKGSFDSSVIALIEGGKPGKVVALRADMDALPIQEETGLPYASENDGAMHACGHDAHTAMVLGAAKILSEHKAELNGSVKLLFQTGEETGTGSQLLIKDKALSDPEVDAIFGLHIGSLATTEIPSGVISAVPGPVLASFDEFILTVKGTGCHGSTPEKGKDPVVIAANIILALENIIAREISAADTAVVTIGKINAGYAYNVIPEKVTISGTTRSFDQETRKYIAKRIGEISENIARAYGGEASLNMVWHAAPVINDNAMAKLAGDAAAEVSGENMVRRSLLSPIMGGEDFAFYLLEKPGAYFFLSSANPDVPGATASHHNCKFTVDEDVMINGTETFIRIVEKFLNE